MAESSAIVERISEFRALRGLSTQQLAERIQERGWPLPYNTLNGIMGRKRQTFGITELSVIADALDVSVAELVPDLAARAVEAARRSAIRKARTELIRDLEGLA